MASSFKLNDDHHNRMEALQRDSHGLTNKFWGVLQLDEGQVDDSGRNDNDSDEYTDIDDLMPEMTQKRGTTPMIDFNFLLTSNGTIKADIDEGPKTSPHFVITQRNERGTKVNYSLPAVRPKLAPPVLEAAPSTPLWRRRRRRATKLSTAGLQRRQATRVPNRKPSPDASPSTDFEDLEDLTWSDCSTPVTPIEMEWPEVEVEKKSQATESKRSVKEIENGVNIGLYSLQTPRTYETSRKDQDVPVEVEVLNTPTTIIDTHSSSIIDGPADSAQEIDVLSRLAWDRQLVNSQRSI